MKNIFAIFIISVLFFSCEKDEIPIPMHEQGDAISQAVGESTYANQLYFDLETNTFVKQNKKTDWDIAFGCGVHSQLILSNTSKSVSVARQNNVNFSDVTSLENLDFIFESSTGHPDSTAFHNWNYNDVFIIDLGYDELGTAQGYGKIKLINNTESNCTFQYGLLSDTNPKTATIDKDSDFNAIFFSIKTESVISVEPPKVDWDICFTQYIYYFHEFDTPYLVSGVLVNRTDVNAHLHNSENYASLSVDDIDPTDFSANLDAIGYTWKVFNNTAYIVNDKMNYIISSTEGFYYKLRFIDFHNNSGAKGYPKFEFQQI